jgi:hypothetical protein
LGLEAVVDGMDEAERESLSSLRFTDCGPLHLAASSGDMAICKYLVEELGFDVNSDASDHGSGTPVFSPNAVCTVFILLLSSCFWEATAATIECIYDSVRRWNACIMISIILTRIFLFVSAIALCFYGMYFS